MWLAKELSPQLDVASPEAFPISHLPLPKVIKKLLFIKGITDLDKYEQLINPKLSSLADPYLLLNMKAAVERVYQSYLLQEKICVYADFDLDGSSGLALMKEGLEQLGFQNIICYQPKRLSQGYGFHAEVVEELSKENVKLIITIDVGITAHRAVATANLLKIDTIITDHHLPDDHLPEATFIVNPNQKACTSGLGYLCGAGVAFYFLRALARKFKEEKQESVQRLDLKKILDYLTLATLTDMVPLIKDNRTLVKFGLKQFETTDRPGFRHLLEHLNLSHRPLNAQDISIKFAPKLNALSRMENGILPIDLLTEKDSDKAAGLIGRVLENNEDRLQKQFDGETVAKKLVKEQSEDDFVFIAAEEFHRGVVGIIATKVSQELNKPAFIGALNPEDGNVVGSCRLPPNSLLHLIEIMKSAESKFLRFGGHQMAAGFEFKYTDLEEIRQLFRGYFKELKKGTTIFTKFYDVGIQWEELNEKTMTYLDQLGPFGQSFDLPLFNLQDSIVQSVRVLKGGHLKLSLSNVAKTQNAEALLFSPPMDRLFYEELIGLRCDVIAELQWNYYFGRKIQLLVKDIIPRGQA